MKGRSQDVGRRASPLGLSLGHFHSTRPVGGLTHGFYRYPATSSPELVRELLLAHTDADDFVLDPFMGGGTTIVEALAHGRRAIGSDLNSLATFVTRVKTTLLSQGEWDGAWAWLEQRPFRPGVIPAEAPTPLQLPRPLRVPLGRALSRLELLETGRQEALVRCALLRTAQWALESSFVYPRRVDDRRNAMPTTGLLNAKLVETFHEMHAGMDEFLSSLQEHGIRRRDLPSRRLLFKAEAEGLLPRSRLAPLIGKVGLVITSPPYPGVHVLYHRWQIAGRRETTAPYWITGQNDGMVLSYYTMGARSQRGLAKYFERLQHAFSTIRPLLRRDALVVQLVAFNQAEEQLPRYLAAMDGAGYVRGPAKTALTLIREVPNRRWYARGNGLDAGKEYLLFHALRT